jgi:hypothetical protein
VGKGSKFETDNRFCQTRGHKGRNECGYPSEVVGKIEGVLGGEEKIRQEVNEKISDQGRPLSRMRKSSWPLSAHAHKAAAA